MNLSDFKKFLTNTHRQISYLQGRGEFFNIFSSLGIEDDERKHSSFIANLLNPTGSHGQTVLFLECFIKSIDVLREKISTLDLKASYVQTELYLGLCDNEYLQGGSVDIAIINPQFTIFIENKIWAKDQLNQLYRYCSYNRNAIVLYLTPYGWDASEISTAKGAVQKDSDYHCISYSDHILNWLDLSSKKVIDKEKVFGSLMNYKYTIESITRGGNMNTEIINSILESEVAIESVFFINKFFDDIRKNLLYQLASQIEIEINQLNKFTFKRENWGFEDWGEGYLHFIYNNGKASTSISLDFEWKKNYFLCYVGISDLVQNKATIQQKKDFTNRCESFGKDMDYPNWFYLTPLPGTLADWNSNIDNWTGIKSGKTAMQLINIIKEIDNRIQGLV